MKHLIISLLIIISIQPELFAQESDCAICPMRFATKTESNFNATWINNRHIVRLKKGEKMTIEMLDLGDYDLLGNMDSLLKSVQQELIAFKDSMNTSPSGNLRIDYVLGTNREFKKIRIQKFDAKGDIYVTKQGDVSRLKLEQDTLRILIQKYKQDLYKKYEPVQITLLLNNYADLSQLITANPDLQHFVDTMRTVSLGRHKHPNSYSYKTSILFDPYIENPSRYMPRFALVEGVVMKNEYGYFRGSEPLFNINFYTGVGMVRDQFLPCADLGIEYRLQSTRGSNDQTLFGIYASPYLTFAKRVGESGYSASTNWFVNAEFGVAGNKPGWYSEPSNFHFSRATLGIGYLLKPDNINFQGTTMKAFFNYTFKNSICVSPEVIFTDNFQSVFPAFTIKYFINSFLDE